MWELNVMVISYVDIALIEIIIAPEGDIGLLQGSMSTNPQVFTTNFQM